MNETTTEQKAITGHIATAVKAIQKQIDKYHDEIVKLQGKATAINKVIEDRRKEIEGLGEQIMKLKGQ